MPAPIHAMIHTPPVSAATPLDVGVHTYRQVDAHPLYDMHYAFEMGVVLDGAMRRYVAETAQELHAGDVWCCGMWEPHGVAVTAVPCRVLVLLFWPSLLTGLRLEHAPGLAWTAPFTCPPDRRPRIAPGQRAAVLALAGKLATGVAPATDAARARQQLTALELLLLALEAMPAGQTRWPASPQDYASISPALELVADARRFLSNAEAADACAMSVTRFTRLFEALMGLSFAKFALRQRLHHVARALATSTHPVKAIARAWGFTDASHLHRLLRAHYGCPPAAFRRRGR